MGDDRKSWMRSWKPTFLVRKTRKDHLVTEFNNGALYVSNTSDDEYAPMEFQNGSKNFDFFLHGTEGAIAPTE